MGKEPDRDTHTHQEGQTDVWVYPRGNGSLVTGFEFRSWWASLNPEELKLATSQPPGLLASWLTSKSALLHHSSAHVPLRMVSSHSRLPWGQAPVSEPSPTSSPHSALHRDAP